MLKLNFIQKLKNFFYPFYKDEDLRFIFRRLKNNNTNNSKTAMFVGGCVRKFLTDQKIDDIDVATILTTDQIKEKFKDTKFQIIDTGLKHGTVTLLSNKIKIEITTLRKDIKTDGRHAEIEYTDDWNIDSERRDFTINAIYLDEKGKMFDPQLGLKDLNNRVVKFIGDPQKRIEEDYLRIIRFIRFTLEYESKVDQKTLNIIKTNLDGIKKISKDRILSELVKILKLKNFTYINKYNDLLLIFRLIFPELQYLERLKRLELLKILSEVENEVLLAILLIDEKNNHEYFAHKYNISNNLKEDLNLLTDNFLKIDSDKKFLKKNLLKNIYFFGKKHLKTLNTLNFCHNKQTKLKDYLDTLKKIDNFDIPKLIFDGNYLKNQGMNEGVNIGKTLKIIEKEWLKNNFKISKEKVLEIIKNNNN